jgi:hypothetical protein
VFPLGVPLPDVSSAVASGKLRPMGPHAMVLAHQGGWDEMLMVAAPVAIFVVLLRVANARAAAQADQDVDVDPDLDPDLDQNADPDPDGDR